MTHVTHVSTHVCNIVMRRLTSISRHARHNAGGVEGPATCQRRYRWHPEKNATQMAAI
eukprot:COSAG04_NODE_17646_length_463_cov_0.986264_1_plen_57_part_10